MPGYVKMGTQPTLPTGGLPSLVLSPCVLKPRGSWEMRPVWPLPPPMGHVPSASAGQLPALTWAPPCMSLGLASVVYMAHS